MAPVDNDEIDETGPRRHPDVYVGVTLLALCGVAFWNTTTFGEVSAMLSQNIPPTFFPRFVLAVIAALSVGLVASGWRRKGERRAKIPGSVFLTAALITGIVALVPRLGMLSTVCLASIVLPLCWGQRRVWWIALLAVLLPLGIYLLFVVGLGMRFPAALLP